MSGMWSFVQKLYDHAFADAAKAFGKWFGKWTRDKLPSQENDIVEEPLKQMEQEDETLLMIEDKSADHSIVSYFSDFEKMHEAKTECSPFKSYLQLKYG